MIRLRRGGCDLRRHAAFGSSLPKTLSPTDHTVPYGTGFRVAGSRHFMPGYLHSVPPGQLPAFSDGVA
jgi:hypothetical protein